MTKSVLTPLLLAFCILPLACVFIGDGDDPVVGTPPDIDVESLSSCAEIVDAVQTELQYIRYCEEDADCGRVLPRTSCGCTRDLVARRGADTTRFYVLVDLGYENSCEMGFVSTCDCPAAEGYSCVENQCTWDYSGAWHRGY